MDYSPLSTDGRNENMSALSFDFKKVLKKFRENAKITQEEMADELNITQSHVSKYERGRKVIDLETFIRWAQVTNSEVQAAAILFGTDVCAQAAQLMTLVPAFVGGMFTWMV
ncbi:helix-turn-helix domain-containing protein [Lysinibacillus capsici]|uniref:helix-turn-helix domain-containing protein n=1 Tax=Lysinibacillus capsici TaxID=2115968 RepID=UPI003D745D03